MFRRVRAFYNPWFVLPFLVWMLIGGILLLVYNRQVLFATVNMNHSDLLDNIMLRLTDMGDGLGVTIILGSMMVFFKSCRNWWYILAAIVCNLFPSILVQAIKSIVHAPRPLSYYGEAPWIHVREHWEHLYHRSFPSGHSASVFSMCCFLSMILPTGWDKFGAGLFVIALLVAYSRMYLAAHFYADIFVGSILGTTGTIFLFALMRRWSNRSFRIVTSRSDRNITC